MKKIFSILSVVALLLSTFGIPITVNAESPKNTPAFNGCLSLTELNVTEAHRLMHYAVYQTPWINNRPEEFVIFQNMLVQYNGAGGHVTVPDGVTVINSAAFRENTEITSVTVPDTCSYIGEAFMGCTALETVDLPPSVKVLNCSFSGCTSLRSIDLSFVEEMGGGTFRDCTSLTEVDLSSVTFMGYWVFMGCTSLHTVTFPANGLEAIHGQSFAKTALTEVILPDSVKTLGDEVFALCSNLTRVETAAETVGNACFNSCASLEEIVFKDGLTTLGSGVFCNSPSLRRIEIPNTLSYVGDNGNLTLPELVIAYKGTEAQFGKVTFEVANKQYNYRNFTRYVVFEEEETEA